MVVGGRSVVEDEMHFMLECPLYSEDRKLLFEKLRTASESLDKGSIVRRVMNPESFEGWKYLINTFKKMR